MEARLEAEREKRIEHTKDMAIRRIAKRDLAKGWLAWQGQYEEEQRLVRMLKGAAMKIIRPKCVAAYRHWREDWVAEETAKREARLGTKLTREMRLGQKAQTELEKVLPRSRQSSAIAGSGVMRFSVWYTGTELSRKAFRPHQRFATLPSMTGIMQREKSRSSRGKLSSSPQLPFVAVVPLDLPVMNCARAMQPIVSAF